MVLRVPARGSMCMKVVYEFPELKGKVVGGSFKLYLRDLLKKVPEYHSVLEAIGIEGKTDTGIPVPVSTLGRWIFGVPGYAGNARFIAYPGEIPRVEVWCGGCSEEVIYAMDKLFEYVGGKRVK